MPRCGLAVLCERHFLIIRYFLFIDEKKVTKEKSPLLKISYNYLRRTGK